jgi:hypothetical protein
VTPIEEATQYCKDAFTEVGTEPTDRQLERCVEAYLKGGAESAQVVVTAIQTTLGSLPTATQTVLPSATQSGLPSATPTALVPPQTVLGGPTGN